MDKQENVVSLKDLEKELATKKMLQAQLENAIQQIIGQITCLESLIKKAKGEDKLAGENNKEASK